MSESNGNVHQCPAGDKFNVRGHEFELDTLDSLYQLRDLSTGLPSGATQKEYLQQVCAWLKEHHDVDLTAGEADWLCDQLELIYAKKKHERAEVLRAVSGQRSPAPMESTPTD